MDHRIVWPNGEVRWLRVREQIYFQREGESRRPHRGILAAFDITNSKNIESALVRSEKLASVGRMASTIAHEINNPLETIGQSAPLRAHRSRHHRRRQEHYLELASQGTRSRRPHHPPDPYLQLRSKLRYPPLTSTTKSKPSSTSSPLGSRRAASSYTPATAPRRPSLPSPASSANCSRTCSPTAWTPRPPAAASTYASPATPGPPPSSATQARRRRHRLRHRA